MDNRTFIGILLIAMLTVAFMVYRGKQQQAAKHQQEQTEISETERQDIPPFAEPVDTGDATERVVPIPGREVTELQPDERIDPTVLTPAVPLPAEEGARIRALPPSGRYEFVFDTAGACLVEARLLNYRTGPDDDSPLLALKSYETRQSRWASLMIRDPRPNGLPLDRVVYEVVEEDDNRIVFQRSFPNGLVVTRRYVFIPEKQHIMLSVAMRNESADPISQQYEITGATRIIPEYYEQRYIATMAGMRDRQKIRVDIKPFKDMIDKYTTTDIIHDNSALMPILWVGNVNKYFAGLLVPMSAAGEEDALHIRAARFSPLRNIEAQPGKEVQEEKQLHNAVASLIIREFTIEPGAEVSHSYMFYLGPKDVDVFRDNPEYNQFQPLIDYGFFDIISSGLLIMLGAFYKVIPNYGVAIILMTLVVRLILHYFTRKSQVSMFKMQQIQPEIKKLQEKYKHDRQRLGKEQMELFKKHNVNPMSGCLPIFLQLPILYGLFRALERSIQLRDAPFMLWINDLSRPDTLTHISGFPINILPILMTAGMLLQQKMLPRPVALDPQAKMNQRMMFMMPLVFVVIFYPMASGLTLYWFTSTTLGIIEQYFIRRHIAQLKQQQAQ